MLFGDGAFGGQLGLDEVMRVGRPMIELRKDTTELALAWQAASLLQAREKALTRPGHADTLIVDIPASTTVRNIFCCWSHPD